jgi:ribonucleoside-diphosphate reductase alpha chain
MSLATSDRLGFAGANHRVGLAGNVSLGENAMRVLRARYLKKDEHGQVLESAADLFRRVAKCIADAELFYDNRPENRSEWEERFYLLMATGQFMPNSPTLMNAGREMGMLSACFVLPVRDSINEIFDSIKHTALIQKAGGGTGFAFDELRPTGDYIKSSGGTTSGPISFWRAFSEATNAIQQGAFRRGANMGMMYIHHPDILKFLYAKQDLTQFTNYNISVKVTDEWMEAYRRNPDAPHVVRNPRTGIEYLLPKELKIWEYDIRALPRVEQADPQGNYYTRREIWDIIIRHAWQTGEPGVVFIDRINAVNPTPHVGRMEATNPCGEQPLLPYEACNLGSINLAQFITDPCTVEADVDWSALRTCVQETTRFLDNVIDANRYPLPEIDAMCKGNRKIGLGIMGFADALYMLGVGYNTDDGVAWGERFMKFVHDESHMYSEYLANVRGNFPNWKGSRWDTVHHRPMRNATCTTVAPTGTISIIASCSCGIEPLFGLAFYRHVLKGQDEGKAPMVEINEIFAQAIRDRGIVSEGLMEQIARDGTLANVPGLPDDIRRVFVCAADVPPEWHVKMQAAFQKHCDASISKTINFPQTATVEDVNTIYQMSFDLACKGVTVYRDGCRKGQPMAHTHEEKSAPSAPAAKPVSAKKSERALEPADLPEIVCGVRVRQITPFGNMHVQITVDPRSERELEVFAQLGKGGDLATSDLEAICRMVSLWLRAGGSLAQVIRQLSGIGSSLQVSTKEGKIMSLGDGLARALLKYTRAKTCFGLRALLLGDYDLSEMDRDLTARAGVGANQHGNGNGNGGDRSDGHGKDSNGIRNLRHAEAAGPLAPDSTGASGPHYEAEDFKVLCPDCQSPLRFGEGCATCEACGFAQC